MSIVVNLILIVVIEFFVVMLTSAAPSLAAYLLGGEKSLNKIVGTLIAPDLWTEYAMALFLVYCAVMVIFYLSYTPREAIQSSFKIITISLKEAASTLHGLLRAGAGILLSFPIMWAIFDWKSFPVAKGLSYFAFGVINFGICITFSACNKVTEKVLAVKLKIDL